MTSQALRSARIGTATLLVVVNVVFWGWLRHTGYEVPLSAFADPEPSVVILPSGGMRFNACHDCGLGFVLAGREIMPAWLQDRGWVRFVMLASLPSRVISGTARMLVDDTLGLYGAMWIETLVFATALTTQWALTGWLSAGMAWRMWSAFRGAHS